MTNLIGSKTLPLDEINSEKDILISEKKVKVNL